MFTRHANHLALFALLCVASAGALACDDDDGGEHTMLDTGQDTTAQDAPPVDTRQPGDAPTDGADDDDVPRDSTAPDDTTQADTGTADTETDAALDGVDGDTHTPADTTTDTVEPCTEPRIHGDAPPLVEVNGCGELSYGRYAAQGESAAVHVVPDFSFAGYRGGGVALPDVPVVVTLDPQPGDDRQRIQDALDTVGAMAPDAEGRRGAVLLRAGEWEISDSIVIADGGVVLRGEGQGTDGTVIRATRAEQHHAIIVQGGADFGPAGGTVEITAEVPVGSVEIEIADASGFAVGDLIAVTRTPNQAWIDALDMAQWGWTASAYAIDNERRVVAIDGNTLTVDIPIVDAIAAQYGGGTVSHGDASGRIEEVGVEHLRVVSSYSGSQDEAHGWKAIVLSRVANSWVRNVTAQHFGYATVSIERTSSFNTVQDSAYIDPVSVVTGSRRYAFNVSSGTANLFQRCYAEQARHDFVTGARTAGPNVWLDSYSHASSNDDGPHHRWSTGILLDNVRSLYMSVENREDSGTGHGWSGGQVMFWNASASGIRCFSPTGAMNWSVGALGEQRAGGWTDAEPPCMWASYGAPVTSPRSLYLQQLEDRLGADAVLAVTTPAQRTGRIWGELAAWAGEGAPGLATPPGADPDCSGGLASGIVCCEASCGACGGTGCGGRPGGASGCCAGGVRNSGRSCAVYGPPCFMDPAFAAVGVAP